INKKATEREAVNGLLRSVGTNGRGGGRVGLLNHRHRRDVIASPFTAFFLIGLASARFLFGNLRIHFSHR
ncbi:hypothetical protein CNR26_24890, partial (plasmid) [Vibrio parahaemolyticus]